MYVQPQSWDGNPDHAPASVGGLLQVGATQNMSNVYSTVPFQGSVVIPSGATQYVIRLDGVNSTGSAATVFFAHPNDMIGADQVRFDIQSDILYFWDQNLQHYRAQLAYDAGTDTVNLTTSNPTSSTDFSIGAGYVLERIKFIDTQIGGGGPSGIQTQGGSFVMGNAALATGATYGFPYIPTMPGPPTGASDVWSGTDPIAYDSVNDRLWVNNSGWKAIGYDRRTAVSANTTVDGSADIWNCSSLSPITMTLPDATLCRGRRITFKNTGGTKVSIVGSSSQTIDGLSTSFPYVLIEQMSAVTLMSNGTNWDVVAQAVQLLRAIAAVGWCGHEVPIPLTSYVGAAQPVSANTELFACSLDGNYGYYITQYDIGWFIGTTNNATNYWIIELRRLNSSSGILSMTTPNTSVGTTNAWVHPTPTTAFSNNPCQTNDVWLEVYVSKFGSPSALNVTCKVMGRKIYV